MPAISSETGRNILAEGEVGGPVNADVIVVVKENELAQTQMASQRGRLMGNPFHQVAITGDDVGEMVKHREIRLIKMFSQPLLGDRHTDGVTHTLPQRSGGCLHTDGVTVLRMARRLAAPLAQMFDLFQRQRVTSQVQQAVQQHRAMSGRQDKSVPIEPVRVFGIVPEKLCP